jgi:S-sulfo-L-cysteine synthase (3-phospho-L-serine-dependent)
MRLILFTPITIQVEAAKRLGFHVTSVWHRYREPGFFDKIIQDVKRLSDEFIEGDLYSESTWLTQVKAICTEFPETLLIPGVPEEFLTVFLNTAQALDQLPNSLATYEFFRNKIALRDLLSTNNKLNVSHHSIQSFSALAMALKDVSSPRILKPAVSSGSKNISRIASKSEAAAALLKWQDANEPLGLVLEDLLDGPQFSVEAVSKNGMHAVLGITEKFPVLPPYYVENGGVFPAQISAELAQEIRSVTLEFLNIAGFRNGATHTELIATPKGVKIVESNARMGGLVPFLIQGAHGIDVSEFVVEYLSGIRKNYLPVNNQVAVLGILSFREGKILHEVNGLEEVRALGCVIKINVWAKNGEILRSPVCNEQRHGYVVVSGVDYQDARKNLKLVQKSIKPIYREEKCLTSAPSSI